MKVIFLGVGEAFDRKRANNSLLFKGSQTILFDCGYSIPQQLWLHSKDPELLDIIYISHCHADHYFGLPSVLGRMIEDKRKKHLTVICHNIETVKQMIELGYKDLIRRLPFTIDFKGTDESFKLESINFSFAQTEHSIENHAVCIQDGGKRVCYSGDGMFTEESEKIYDNADLLVHETYLIALKKPGHASIIETIEMARRSNVKMLALTHIHRHVRGSEMEIIKDKANKTGIKVIVPNQGTELQI